jgi:hypothetical protein
LKSIYITKDGQVGDAKDLFIVKNLSDNRVELIKEAPADVRQRLALEFADDVSDSFYFDGKIIKSSGGGQDKDTTWDWFINDYEHKYNSESHVSDTYKNGVLVTAQTNVIPKFVFDLADKLSNAGRDL